MLRAQKRKKIRVRCQRVVEKKGDPNTMLESRQNDRDQNTMLESHRKDKGFGQDAREPLKR